MENQRHGLMSCGNHRRRESEAASIRDCKAKELKEKIVDQWM